MEKIRKIIKNIKSWFKNNKKEGVILLIILLVGAFLRLYRISEYMTFLGDEGRDVIVVRRLLANFDLILIGPGTSIGNMYLGPLYYYMMALPLWLFDYSPVGPSVQVAILGVITIFMVWYITRKWFPVKGINYAGLVASLLYAISPTVIIYSRSSWNPNVMPFFALLAVYSIWKVWKEKAFKWLIVGNIALAFSLQSHYLALLLIPVISVYWLTALLNIKKDKTKKKGFVKMSALGGFIFAFLMSPLVIFDYRHGWRNFSAMKEFFVKRQTTVSARPWNAIPNAWPNFVQIMTRLTSGHNEVVGVLFAIFLVIIVLGILIKRKSIKKGFLSSYYILFIWIGFALLGLGLYKQNIYDHYYGFFFPAPFMLLGAVGSGLYRFVKSNLIKVLLVLGFAVLVVVSLYNTPIKSPPNRQMQRAIEVSSKMVEESKGELFNMAVIAERNYEGAYWYFLEKDGANAAIIDPQRLDETLADQLFVVCEKPKEECSPTSNPKAEIANFGWSKIDKEWEVSGVILYKLVHVYEL